MPEVVISTKRVSKVVKGGRRMSFRVIVGVGNNNGRVGVGMGKSRNIPIAIKKGIRDAQKNIIIVPITNEQSIPHLTNGRFGAAKLLLLPAAKGCGIIAGNSVRSLLELAGIRNILSKQFGAGDALNNAKATINALSLLRSKS